jgi:hypothetical protein
VPHRGVAAFTGVGLRWCDGAMVSVGAVKLKPQSFSRDDVRHGDRMRKCGGDSPTQALGIVKHPSAAALRANTALGVSRFDQLDLHPPPQSPTETRHCFLSSGK